MEKNADVNKGRLVSPVKLVRVEYWNKDKGKFESKWVSEDIAKTLSMASPSEGQFVQYEMRRI